MFKKIVMCILCLIHKFSHKYFDVCRFDFVGVSLGPLLNMAIAIEPR